MEESNVISAKMVEELKKELGELKAKHESNIRNVDGHFDKESDVTMPDAVVAPAPVDDVVGAPVAPPVGAPMGAATASGNSYVGFNKRFDFTPRNGWRSNANHEKKPTNQGFGGNH
jgi:hypothetical protein